MLPKAKNTPRSKQLKKSLNAYSRSKGSSTKLAIFAILFLVFCLLSAKTYLLISSISKPFSNLATNKQFSWDDSTSVNIVFKSSTISVLRYDPKEKKVTILKIPDQTYIEVPRGFGAWNIGAVYKLGQAETPPVGASLLKDSISKLLGLPIDGLIVFKDEAAGQEIDKLISDFNSSPFPALSLLKKIDTDLSLAEMFNLYVGLSKVRSDKIITLDLDKSNITYSKLLPDSSRVLGIDNVILDKFIRENLGDSQILQEGVSIAVFNGTSHPGLAFQAARVVTNMGGDVVIVGNTEGVFDKSLVIFTQDSISAKRLSSIFAPWCQKSCESQDPKLKSQRAQINIILGEDYYKSWFLR